MTVCNNCGFQNNDDAGFCSNCGSVLEKKTSPTTPTPPTTLQPAAGASQTASGRAVAAIILGISSIVMSCGPFTGIIAIILANQELRAIQNGTAPMAGKTLSQIGLWTGWIGTVVCTLFWIVYFAFIFMAVSGGLGGAFR